MLEEIVLRRLDRANHRLFAEAVTRSGGEVRYEDGVCMVIGTHPSPVIANTAFRFDRTSAGEPEEILRRVLDAYARVGHGVSMMSTDRRDADLIEAMERTGWRPVVAIPGMLLPTPIEPIREPDGASATWVGTDRDLAAFRTVMIDGFADDDDERGMLAAMFAAPRTLEPPGVRGVVASVDGHPAAAAAVYAFEEASVIGFVATVPELRGRGLGTYVTALVANAAFADGAEIVSLQASPMGLPVYTAMGFERVAEYRVWFPPD